jgi:ribosomal protein S27E
MAKSTRYGIFKVIATCTHCGNPVVVNGPMTAPKCPSCRKELELSPDIWSEIIGDYVEEYEDNEPGSGNEGTMMSGGLTLKYSYIKLPPPDPACPKCEENWDLDTVENGASRMLACSKCGHTTPVFPAPSWLREVVPSAKQIFFAEKESDQPEEGRDAGEARPIALACPQCGGGLVITADCERTVPCKYCNVDVYLPDGVWLKLHPAKVAKYWMVRFED